MSYSYLDGTIAGSLLGTPQANQAPTPYVPGQGMAPYAATSVVAPVSTSVGTGAVSGALATAQKILANPGSSPDNIFWANQVMSQQAPSSGSTFSTVPAYPGSTTSTAPAGGAASTGSGLTVIGQQTPEELARNASIMNAPVGSGLSFGGSSGGGGGGAAGGTTSGSSFGSGLFQPTSSATSAGAAPSSVPIYNAPSTSGVPYNSPGGLQAAPQSQGGVLAMQQADPRSAINQYQNTAGYQMLGNDQTNQYQQSPGYQYAVNEALRQVQSQGASRGLLDSGRVQRDMTDRALGMAQQDYGNWWNRQNQLYSDYQNRLAGLAGGSVGADQANQLGTNQAQGTYQTGGNLASLFGNQGVAGFGGITNTGAAQSNNMTQAGATQAQIQAANQSTQLAGATLQQRQF